MRQTTPRCVGPNALPGARLPEAPLPTALSMAATSLWVAVKRVTQSEVAGDGKALGGGVAGAAHACQDEQNRF